MELCQQCDGTGKMGTECCDGSGGCSCCGGFIYTICAYCDGRGRVFNNAAAIAKGHA